MFIDSRKILESRIASKIALACVEIPERRHDKTNESKVLMKCGRSIGSKDKIPLRGKHKKVTK